MKKFTLLLVLIAGLAAIIASTGKAEELVHDGSQPSQTFNLSDVEKRILYEDRTVEYACTRREQRGTRTECRTEYREECDYVSRRECHQVPRRECTPITRRECRNETRRECQTEYRNECSQENVCRDVRDEVCRTNPNGTRVCTPINRRECHLEQRCRNVPHQTCRNIPDTVCRDVRDEVCRTWSETECRDVRDRVCHSIPERRCEEVPNYVDVPDTCSRVEHFPVGEEVVYAVGAAITVNFGASPAGVTPHEVFDISLDGDEVTLKLVKDSGRALLLVDRKIDTRIVSPKEKLITAVYDVTLIGVDEVMAPISTGISELQGEGTLVRFLTGKVRNRSELGLGLRLKRETAVLHRKKTLFDGEVPEAAFSLRDLGERTELTLDLEKLSLSSKLKKDTYQVTVRASLKPEALGRVINPGALPEKRDTSADASLKLRH